MSQKLHLKWNNHMSLMKEFKNFLSFGSMVDVTLACDGQSLKAHKIVLSACSSFFKSLFLENPCQHPIVILKDIRYTELKAIIDFMYCGEVYVAENQLSTVIKVAQTLRIKGLGEVSQDDQSDYEFQNSSDDELQDSATKTSDNHPGDATIIQNETFRRKESVIEQNPALETVIVENPNIKQEVVCDDMNDSIPSSNASEQHFEFPRVNFPTPRLKHLLEHGTVLTETFQDSSPNLKGQAPTTDNLQRRSFQSPTQLNKELHENHSDNLFSLASGAATHVSSDAIVTDNQQPSTSSASGASTHVSSDAKVTDNQQPSTSSAFGKRHLRKSVRQPLQKKVKIVKNSPKKSVQQQRKLRVPEVVIISESDSVKNHEKIKDSEITKTKRITKNKVKLYECRICPFKTVCQKILKTHLNSRHPDTRKFKCGQCGFVAQGKYKFERHKAVHQGKGPHHCSFCSCKFYKKTDLKKHVKTIHKLDRPLFKCEKCDFSALEKVSVKKHMMEAHERIPAIVIDKLPDKM